MRMRVLLTLRGGSGVSLRHCRKSCRASSSLPMAARACPRRIHASPYVGISAMVALKSSTAPYSSAVTLRMSFTGLDPLYLSHLLCETISDSLTQTPA